MKSNYHKIKTAITSFIATILAAIAIHVPAYAESITMSPMNQRVVITPGDSYSSSFTISNPGTATTPINYDLAIQSFYVDENYNSVFGEPGKFSEITEWITIDSPESGSLAPNEAHEINFTIHVPEDAPSGGQYAAIIASIKSPETVSGTSIQELPSVAHIIFAEITGETIKQGEITGAEVPSFLLSGNITASSTIKNTGNVHGTATYTLKVTPAFGGDDIYNNEENPEIRTIVPDRTFYNEITVDKTPTMGLFNVVYTVSFEGVTTEVSKLVIICPIWLLFILALVIIGIIISIIFFLRAGHRR